MLYGKLAAESPQELLLLVQNAHLAQVLIVLHIGHLLLYVVHVAHLFLLVSILCGSRRLGGILAPGFRLGAFRDGTMALDLARSLPPELELRVGHLLCHLERLG